MGCSRSFLFFILGWIVSGNFFGGLVGFAIGVWLDQRDTERLADRRREQTERTRSVFLLCMMSSFAKIAKSDGRVSATEIQLIENMLDEWGLGPSDVSLAKDIFRKAKDDNVLFVSYVDKFATECAAYELRLIFLQCLVRLACAEGSVSDEQMKMLRQAESIFGLPSGTVHMMISQFTGQRHSWGRYSQESRQNYGSRYTSSTDATDDDYTAIGVSRSATDVEVKKAYRRKAMELHPDKIQAKGLPPEFIKNSNDQLAMVNVAYDRICKTRGMK